MRLFEYILLQYRYKKNKIFVNSLDVSIKAKLGLEVSVGKNSMIDAHTDIGNYTYIGKNCNITKSTIGKYCSIANNVSIGQGEHTLNKVSTSSLFYENKYEELTKEPCVIQNDVWIGTDSIILRGVTIGNGAVVGANSVVTKDIPPFAIVAGSPARILRYRFDSEKQYKILETQWWEKELGGATQLIRGLEK
ncbi:CatB-related O-acetyltransferase [bacterium]|nr:CatB-related O-acetyltransferase [bacterium]MBU1959433.1 CatB-related O-acetyltransferase [bacterium]